MNPILSQLMGSRSNNALAMLGNVRQMIGGNPEAAFRQMMNNNPQFRKFVNDNRGKSPEQIAQENGIDFNLIRRFIG